MIMIRSEYGPVLRLIFAFIPKHVKNRTVVRVMDILRKLGHFRTRLVKEHLSLNESLLKDRVFTTANTESPRFIENQKSLKDIKLGRSDIAYAGCEVIAVHNILGALNMTQVSFAALISLFEKDGIMFGGRFGVAVNAMRDRLKELGLKVEDTTLEDKMSELLDASEAAILTFYNDRTTIGAMVHSVCITKAASDGYYVHNMHGDGNILGPYTGFDHMMSKLNDGRSKPISLIGVRRSC